MIAVEAAMTPAIHITIDDFASATSALVARCGRTLQSWPRARPILGHHLEDWLQVVAMYVVQIAHGMLLAWESWCDAHQNCVQQSCVAAGIADNTNTRIANYTSQHRLMIGAYFQWFR